MGKYDKDRFQKELAVRYCIARDMVPFLEVLVRSVSDLSDTSEVLTDLDVVGIEAVGDGGLRRTIFDCKSSGKMSAVNRAFWAAGVKAYTDCDDVQVILKTRAVNNHRLSALTMDVDLHDEESFKALGKSIDAAFPADHCYLTDHLRQKIGEKVKVVDRPGPGVATLSVAITGVAGEKEGLKPYQVIPVAFVITMASRGVSGTPEEAKLVVEARATDSVTGTTLLKVVRVGTGEGLEKNAEGEREISLASVKPLIDRWAEEVAATATIFVKSQ
jgi:hypothetical protein